MQTIIRIRKLLNDDEPCVVVSTQLVEAGVDIDFPIVYRAFAGAGSMAQAAGRCNREGRRSQTGELRVFFAPKEPPRGVLHIGFSCAQAMWNGGLLNLTDPLTFTEYYRRVYKIIEADPGVLAAERELRFADAAEKFRMIDEVGEQIVAPFGQAEERVKQIAFTGITRKAMRRLQPFLVTLYKKEIDALRLAGAIVPVAEGCDLWRVLPQYKHVYDLRFGFGWQGPLAAEPEFLIG
jgi:CRISPR-associated endonuclease/helicase Cas3